MAPEQSPEGLVYAAYHQFFLAPLDVQPIYHDRDAGPFVVVTDNRTALIVVTGCADGLVLFAIELREAAPGATAAWEVQEEVDLPSGRRRRFLTSPGSLWRLD